MPPIRAELTGSNLCSALGITARAAAPVLALCRQLVAAGHDPALSYNLDSMPPVGAHGPYEERLVGSTCTVGGQPGVLEKSGDWLVCKPTRTDSAPAARTGVAAISRR